MINPTMVPRVPTFAEYNERTEDMISHLLEWLDEDAVLSEATRYPKLNRFVIQRPMRDNINDYRRSVCRHSASTGSLRKFREFTARYQAFILRFGARRYVHRAGFDRQWLRSPR